MKKSIVIFFLSATILISLFTACSADNNRGTEPNGDFNIENQLPNGDPENRVPPINTNPDQAIEENPNTDIEIAEDVEFAARFLRTGWFEESKKASVHRIGSRAELCSYYDTYREDRHLNFGYQADEKYSGAHYFLEFECSEYDDRFFEEHVLIIVVLQESSGSIRHKINRITRTAQDHLSVYIDPIVPEAGTCDMAAWHIMIAIENENAPKKAADIKVFYNDFPLSDEIYYTEPKPQMPIRTAPPALKLIDSEYNTVQIPLGSYKWNYPDTGSGTMVHRTADAPHPLKNPWEPIPYSQKEIKLGFEETPDEIALRIWPKSALATADILPEEETEPITTEEITVNNYPTVSLKSGDYIYEIVACWKEESKPYYGTVCYSFCASIQP